MDSATDLDHRPRAWTSRGIAQRVYDGLGGLDEGTGSRRIIRSNLRLHFVLERSQLVDSGAETAAVESTDRHVQSGHERMFVLPPDCRVIHLRHQFCHRFGRGDNFKTDRVGRAIGPVTHDQSEALTMSDRIAVFNDGAIQQLATPDDLYERPQNSFVAQFIGENNRLHGKVIAVNGTACQVEVAGGSKVEAMPVKVGGPGAATTLSLRPERVRLNPVNGGCVNIFSAQVEELIYLGDHTRVRASVCGNHDFVIKVPNSEGVPNLTPGAAITVGWKKEDCRALDAF